MTNRTEQGARCPANDNGARSPTPSPMATEFGGEQQWDEFSNRPCTARAPTLADHARAIGELIYGQQGEGDG